MKLRYVPKKPFFILAALTLFVSSAVIIRAAMVSDNGNRQSAAQDVDWRDFTSGAMDSWNEFAGGYNKGAGEFSVTDNGSDVGFQPVVEEGSTGGPYEPVSASEPPGSISLGSLSSSGGGWFHLSSSGYSRSYYGGSNWYWKRYQWLRKYYRNYFKKYSSRWKKRQWLVPDSMDSYFVSTPGSFGVYNPAGGAWVWQADTEEDALAAGEPVTTENAVNVILSSPRKGSLMGTPIYFASFDRWSGDELFILMIPPGVESVGVSENDGSIHVETCFGGAFPCQKHSFSP